MTFGEIIEYLSKHNEKKKLIEVVCALGDANAQLARSLVTNTNGKPSSPIEHIIPSEFHRNKLFDAVIEEYRALRSEQMKRFEAADKILRYLAILVAAVLGAFVSLYSKTGGVLNIGLSIILITPIFITPLIFTAINYELMVIRIGVYCYGVLRPKIALLTSHTDVWDWERYHVKKSKNVFFSISSFLRRFVYIMPSLLPLLAFVMISKPPYDELHVILIIVDVILAITTIIMVIYAFVVFISAVRDVR